MSRSSRSVRSEVGALKEDGMTSPRSHPRLFALLVLLLGAVLALGWFTASQTLGFSSYKRAFNDGYGTEGSRLDDCPPCHNPDNSLNDYGQSFADAGADDAAVTALQPPDSGGRGG